MNKQEYINTAEKELLHTYNRFSLVLDHGEGVHLYDTDGKVQSKLQRNMHIPETVMRDMKSSQ